MLTIAKFDRYDLVNNPGDKKPSFTIWFSGCTFKCKGCHNSALWNKNKGNCYSTETTMNIVHKSTKNLGIDSVVLLGGEPLQQQYFDFYQLLINLHQQKYNVWLYTAYDFNEIPSEFLPYLHTIKCGRYIESKAQSGFPASTNQKVYRYIENQWREI